MKKLCNALLLILVMVTTAQGQIAFEGGLNAANLSLKEGGTKLSTKFLIRSAIGIMADIRVSGNHFYFEPGLYYKGDGAIVKDPSDYPVIINTTTLNLNVEYKTGEKCGNRFFFGVGPYFGFINTGGYDFSAYGGDPLKQVDFGPAFNLGYLKRKHLYLRLSYQLGVVNLLVAGDDKNSIKTSNLGLTAGFLMGGCRVRRYGGSRGHTNNHWRGLRNNGQYRKERNYKPSWLGY